MASRQIASMLVVSGAEISSSPLARFRSYRQRRVPHFSRPKNPHDWHWVVAGIGKTLIVVGLLMFAFVGYQLWGTGIRTAQAQNRLEDEFRAKLESITTVGTTPTTVAGATTVPTVPSETTTTTVPTAAPSERRSATSRRLQILSASLTSFAPALRPAACSICSRLRSALGAVPVGR